MSSSLPWPVPAHEAGQDRVVDQSTIEREVKLAVPSLEPIDERLRGIDGATFLHTVHERNYVLDTAQDDLKGRDERLRIREIVDTPGVQITWKGPAKTQNGIRRREEREFHADDRAACIAILSNLGLRPVRSYEKMRSSWRVHDAIVCLDTLPFGSFVEIEFTSKISEQDERAVLERIIAALELQDAPRVQASYARLQQEWEKKQRQEGV